MTNNLSQFSSVSWSTGEAVTVNTRALIDKVLARYSADHTVFRELFQNAADADARHVILKWESGEELPPGVGVEISKLPDLREEKGDVLPDNITLASKSEKADGVGSNRGVLGSPPQPPPPYFEKAVGNNLGVSDRDLGKRGKKKRSVFSRLRTTLSKNDLSSPDASSSAALASQTGEEKPRFSTTGQNNNNQLPNTSSYAQSSEVLRNLIWSPLAQVGDEPQRKLYRRLIVQNDGKSFGVADWARLKRIAEGNPDETKIGAFGVGFYSVFSECDEPAVFSGGKAMAFYWDGDRENGGGNQLMTRTAEAGEGADDGWTVFNLPYRKPTPLPGIPELLRFLATSLVFVRLESIIVFIDGVKLFTIEKRDLGIPTGVALPKGLAMKAKPSSRLGNTDEGNGIKMDVTEVTTRQIEMRAIYVDGVFGDANQGNGKGKGLGLRLENVVLEISTATVITDVDAAIAAELKRAILKPPPKETTLSMVCAATTTTDVATETSNAQVFSHILPRTIPQDELPTGSQNDPGRVFIGFQTHQTTGFQCHLSTHSVIPTVERENIDFNARYVKDWNLEIIRMAGILARCMYDYDMQRLHKLMTEGPHRRQVANQIAKRIMQKFAFRQTTPSTHVGDVVKQAFFDLGWDKDQAIGWNGTSSDVDIMSSKGVKAVKDVLLPVSSSSIHKTDRKSSDCDWLIEEFVENIPVVMKVFVDASPVFVSNLSQRGILRSIVVGDVIRDLKSRVLTQPQARSLLSWLAQGYEQSSGESRITIDQVKQVLREVSVKPTAGGSPLKLSIIKYFLGNSGPLAKTDIASLPPSCIPPELLTPELQQSKSLESIFGWAEMKIEQWLNHIVLHKSSLSKDVTFATNVLRTINSGWSSYSFQTKSDIKRTLDLCQCIPTGSGHGICVPARVHFPYVNWVGKLPVLAPELAEKEAEGVSEDFLKFLGVRKTVELKTVLERLMTEVANGAQNGTEVPHSTCNQAELVNYLLTLQEEIPPGDMHAIKNIAFCSAEKGKKLFKPSELYEPREELRRLDLPTMFWPTPWEQTSFAIRKILEDLGLNRAPDIVTLAKIAARAGYDNSTAKLRERALKYMVENWATNNYTIPTTDLRNIRFLPVADPLNFGKKGVRLPPATLVALTECYWNPRAGILGFNVLRSDLKDHASKLQILEHPPIEELVKALLHNPPQDEDSAKVVFTYMAQFTHQLTPMLINQLRVKKMVPVRIISYSDKSSGMNDLGSNLSTLQKQKTSIVAISTASKTGRQYDMRKPSEVFTSSSLASGTLVARLFEFVDFGVIAGQFLQKLGAKTSPSDHDVAVMLVTTPWKVLQVLGPHEYQNRLKQLSMSRNEIWLPGSELERKMQTSKFLLGEITQKRSLAEDGDESEDENGNIGKNTKTMMLRLVSASEVLIADEYTSYKLFRDSIVVCPQDDTLEEMYLALGSLKLSDCVEMKYHTGPAERNSPVAETLRKLIVERTPLFFYENHFRGSRTPVKKWLSGIEVKVVSHIRLERRIDGKHTLQGVTVENAQVSTAAIPENMTTGARVGKSESANGNTVLVCSEWNSYDLAFAVVGRLCRSPSPGAIYLLDCLLKEDLKVLESRGYNVHRILRAKEEEAKLFAIKPPKEIKEMQMPLQPGANTTGTNGVDGGLYSWRSKDKDVQTALTGAKPFSGTIINSQPTMITMAAQTYCDHMPGQELVYHSKLTNGIRVFMEKGKGNDFQKNQADFESFSRLMGDIGTAMGLPLTSIHLCYEKNGRTIAFNSGGSLFFNLHFWQKHGHNQPTSAARTDAITWWFMVMCHELAHNLVKFHNTEHSSHIENIAAKHLPSIARLLPNVVVDNQGQMIFPQVGPVSISSTSRGFRSRFLLSKYPRFHAAEGQGSGA